MFSVTFDTEHGNLSFLLDTQAEISLIKIDSLLEDTLVDTGNTCSLKGITDESLTSLGSVNMFLLVSDVLEIEQNFQVVKKSFPIPTNGILGKDFLVRNGCLIDALSNELVIRYQEGEITIDMTKPNSRKIFIPPRSQSIRKISVGISEDVVMEKMEIKPGVFVAGSISSRDKPFVSILNVNDDPQCIDVEEIQFSPLSNFSICSDRNNKRTILLKDNLNLENVSETIVNQLVDLCKEFSDIFHLPGDKLSCNNFYEQEIVPIDETPVFRKNFQIPHAQKQEVDSQVKEMLENDVIEHSESPYNSPIFLVPKKTQDGAPKKWRLVVDFRLLNEKILPDRYPIPRIDEVLEGLGDAQYFSTLDMQAGFHQIPLKKSSRKYTAFSTWYGHYQFKRLPFGINICPNSFQRMVNLAMSGLPPDICFLYLDDIIVVGRSEKHHLHNLRVVFSRLRSKNLKLNPSKCVFYQREVTFLGHKITDRGIFPDDSKIEMTKNFPKPVNAKETKRFVAFANFYRKFIKDFSVIAAPLHNVAQSNVKFLWSDECENSFNELKRALSNPPILIYPNFDEEFILITDASDLGCGAKLAQIRDGVEMPISFASKAFKKGELNRPPIEKEMMAIYFGITHFRSYLYGRKFLVKTDHKPLVHLFSMKNPASKILRMRLELCEYDFVIEYIPGKDNVEADALSRVDFKTLVDKQILAVTRSMTRKTLTKINNPETEDHLVRPRVYEASFHDEAKNLPTLRFKFSEVAIVYDVRRKRSQLFNGNKVIAPDEINENALKELLIDIENTAVKNDIDLIALRLDDDIFRYVSPTELKGVGLKTLEQLNLILYYPRKKLDDSEEIKKVLSEFHDHPMAGHPGQQRMLEKLRMRYSWKNMRRDVKQYVQSCEKCKFNKVTTHTNERFMLTTTPTKPFDVVVVDTIGLLPVTTKGNRYILSIQCDFSKYVVYVPMPTKEARTVASALVNHCILVYGPMRSLRSDRGTEFVNETLNAICEILGVDKLTATAYHPQTIGALERNHRVMNEYFRTSLPSMTDWDDWLPYFAFAFNTHPSSSHKLTPFELIFGRAPNLTKDMGTVVDPLYNHDSYEKDMKYRLSVAFNNTRKLLLDNKQKTVDKQTKVKPLELKLGSKVKLLNEQRTNKFDTIYTGPYEVTKLLGCNVEIEDKNNKKQLVHKNRLQLY